MGVKKNEKGERKKGERKYIYSYPASFPLKIGNNLALKIQNEDNYMTYQT